MDIQTQTRESVRQFPAGSVFGYRDLPSYGRSPAAATKAVSRLVQGGELRRLSKGRFYRPKRGILGEQGLPEREQLKQFLYRDGRRIGYVTGARLYNRLGLTTQIPKTVTIAWGGARQTRIVGTLRVKLVSSRAPVGERSRPLIELLDALKDIRRIPDSSPAMVLDVLVARIAQLSRAQRQRMVRLAVAYYPSATRALLGLVLEVGGFEGADVLKASLNPLTRYKIDLAEDRWAQAADGWNIQ